jgi:anti-anti-sigma factor
MATEWSDSILIADLGDEPSLSDDLTSLYAQLADAKEEGKVPDVVINMASVSYLNSSNIAQLLRVRKLLIHGESRMKLCGVTPDVWSVMQLTGLEKVFEFEPDKATALAALQLDASAND